MGERSEYAPGTFSWVDLATIDIDAAKAFYGGLFGWQAEDLPIGDEGTHYSIQSIRGSRVAAIVPQRPQQREAGAPPTWQSYVTVRSADEAAARATELGADVHAGPLDVSDDGRLAVIRDPQGAFVIVWEPRQSIGAALVNEPGALAWNELATADMEGSQEFYGGLFGWTFQRFEASEDPYFVVQNGGRGNGGMRAPQPGEPPHWMAYFAVADIDEGLGRARDLGGNVLAGPVDIGIARIGVVADPQGAVFSLYAGELEP